MPETPCTLEVCVDTAQGMAVAQRGADRIELCAGLALGGLTPGPGLLAMVRDSSVPVYAMIRPRAGGFHYDSADQAACRADIAAARAAGCAGIVIGAAKDDGLDKATLATFVDAAGDMTCTLHRVIDQLRDPLAAQDCAIDLGIACVLTSGGAPRAPEGLTRLAAMHRHAAGRITVMAGSGVTADTAAPIAKATGIRAFHSSCSVARPASPSDVRLGFAPPAEAVTDPAQIAALRAVLDLL